MVVTPPALIPNALAVMMMTMMLLPLLLFMAGDVGGCVGCIQQEICINQGDLAWLGCPPTTTKLFGN